MCHCVIGVARVSWNDFRCTGCCYIREAVGIDALTPVLVSLCVIHALHAPKCHCTHVISACGPVLLLQTILVTAQIFRGDDHIIYELNHINMLIAFVPQSPVQ